MTGSTIPHSERARQIAEASDPWAEMDAWCKAESAKVSESFNAKFWAGTTVDHPDMRHLHGQSQSLHRMRSYISGARKVRQILQESPPQ